MPAFICISGYVLLALGISDDKAVFIAVPAQPVSFCSIGKAEGCAVDIHCETCLMLGMAGFCRYPVRSGNSSFAHEIMIDGILERVAAEAGNDIEVYAVILSVICHFSESGMCSGVKTVAVPRGYGIGFVNYKNSVKICDSVFYCFYRLIAYINAAGGFLSVECPDSHPGCAFL